MVENIPAIDSIPPKDIARFKLAFSRLAPGVKEAYRREYPNLPAELFMASRDDVRPAFHHEGFHEVNIEDAGASDHAGGWRTNPSRTSSLDGATVNYAQGYDTPSEFKEHFEAINAVKPILSMDKVIADNLRINHNVRIGDGRFSTNMYLVDQSKIKTWGDIKGVAYEFFEFMDFSEKTITRTVEGSTLRFTAIYHDDKRIPISLAVITFTKQDDGRLGIQVSACVAVENPEARPNYAKHLVEDWLSFYGQAAPVSVVFRKIYWQYGNPSYRHIKSSRLGDPAYDEFYPWITCGIKKYIEDYLASPASVLLLIGLPGTGKSTLIRSLRGSPNARMFMCDAAPLAREEDPFEKIAQLFSHTEYEDNEGDGPNKRLKFDQNILIVEDADDIIHSRKDGNRNMARLLSLTNGLDNSEKVKVVISTNLDNIDKVDEALLRPGRCFDILSFRALTVDEANKARAMIGKGPRDFGDLKAVPLAVALSDDQTSAETIVTPRYAV